MEIPDEVIAERRRHAEKVKTHTILPDGFQWRTSGNVAAGDLFMDFNGTMHPVASHHPGQSIAAFYAIAQPKG